MAIKIVPSSGSAKFPEIQTYSINIDAVSTDATDSGASTGSMSLSMPVLSTKVDANGNRVNLPGAERTTALLGREVSLYDYGMFSDESKFDYQKIDYGRGAFFGTVSSMSLPASGVADFSVDSILFKLNCEKTADPHFGAGATMATAFIYYCSLGDIIVNPDNISSRFKISPVAYIAWRGNVWEYIKMFCVANQAEIFFDALGNVGLKDIRKTTISVKESSGANLSTTLLGTSRKVEITEYKSTWETDTVIARADTAYQVNFGEQKSETIEMEASTIESKIFQPTCVTRIDPLPFSGGIGISPYVVVDNLNIPVPPAWWNGNGGKVTVSISKENNSQIIVSIKAPDILQSSSPYQEPFRLAEVYSDATQPALFICGEGVRYTKELRTVDTGADEKFISRDSKATVDNLFISDASYHLIQSAANATGPTTSVSLTIGSSGLPDEINKIAGARFFYNNGYYRVVNANVSDSGIGLTGKADTVFDDLASTYSANFNQYNNSVSYAPNNFNSFNTDALNSGKKFSDFNLRYPALTFEQVGSYYFGMTFSDMSIIPLGDTLNPYDN